MARRVRVACETPRPAVVLPRTLDAGKPPSWDSDPTAPAPSRVAWNGSSEGVGSRLCRECAIFRTRFYPLLSASVRLAERTQANSSGQLRTKAVRSGQRVSAWSQLPKLNVAGSIPVARSTQRAKRGVVTTDRSSRPTRARREWQECATNSRRILGTSARRLLRPRRNQLRRRHFLTGSGESVSLRLMTTTRSKLRRRASNSSVRFNRRFPIAEVPPIAARYDIQAWSGAARLVER